MTSDEIRAVQANSNLELFLREIAANLADIYACLGDEFDGVTVSVKEKHAGGLRVVQGDEEDD